MATNVKLVCPSCTAINRFPVSRIDSDPRCGKCKQSLLGNAPIEVNSKGLGRHVQHSDLPVMVDFWAPWCGPCRSFAPTFASYAGKNAVNIRCLKVNTEDNRQAGMAHQIRSIPTLALFHHGKEVNRLSGALSESQLQQWVAQQLA